jgi:hypothetical protein
LSRLRDKALFLHLGEEVDGAEGPLGEVDMIFASGQKNKKTAESEPAGYPCNAGALAGSTAR